MPMKVTVCFGRVKVLVPCGDGNLLVREVVEKAITRYKKACGKANDYWVSVHTIRTVSEDSILDPDDVLSDVADDREQLIADFEEQGSPGLPHNGDGASASSAGTASPDIFQGEQITDNNKNLHQRGFSLDGRNDVIVTPRDISVGSGLTVRRGSEPALNLLDEIKSSGALTNGTSSSSQENGKENSDSDSDERTVPFVKHASAGKAQVGPFSRFSRDSWRQSLGNQPKMFKWLEAQERQEDRIRQNTEAERKEPVGGATSPEQKNEKLHTGRSLPPLPPQPKQSEVAILICLKNDGTPLGIHVVPDFNEDGKECGLMVQSIEPGGRIDQDGRLKVDDRIVEINEQPLHEIKFPKAQEIFRSAMKTQEVRLKVVKHKVPPLPKKPPPAVLPKPKGHTPTKPSPLTLLPNTLEVDSTLSSPDKTSTPLEKSHNSQQLDNQKQNLSSSANNNSDTKNQTVTVKQDSPVKPTSPVKKAPPAPPVRHPSTTLTSSSSSSNSKPATTKPREALIIAPTNTKKIGKKIEVELVKGSLGLGFSVTTRDNPAGGLSPIYIKNILPKGAAVTDGRLKAGDRLLEVNGVEMTGKTQADAVSVLRNTKQGSLVSIIVSRQDVEDERFKVPRELKDDLEPEHDLDPNSFQPMEKAGDDGTLAVMRNKELIELNIPLSDSGSAGLGVSVKGKTLTTEMGTRDLGIFVKAVIHGGAASKDGRLAVNDQLLEVNDSSLINLTNTEAMDSLRKAMQNDGPVPGYINIKVARKIGAPSPSPFETGTQESFDFDQSGSVNQSGHTDENSSSVLSNMDQSDGDHVVEIHQTPEPRDGEKHLSAFKSPNIFLDRILAGNGLRNESYSRATQDSFVDSPVSKPPVVKDIQEQDEAQKQEPERRHSQDGHSPSSSSEDLREQPPWLNGPDWTKHSSQASDEELSPVGDGFSRDGFARQSMSEKRKTHFDPRSSEFYQRAKEAKETNKDNNESKAKRAASFHVTGLRKAAQHSGSYGQLIRSSSAESVVSRSNSSINRNVRNVGLDMLAKSNIRGQPPPSNLKRFNSLENLTTMQDQDISTSFDDDPDSPPSPQQPRMARKRGGNESFRAAVDRSYDPVPHIDMDPLEEESSEGGSLNRDQSNSARSSFSDVQLDDPFGRKRGKKGAKDTRRSGGILKGFLKFARGRKTPDEHLTKGEATQPDKASKESTNVMTQQQLREQQQQIWEQQQREQQELRLREAQVEQERSQEQFRRLQEHHFLEQQRQQQQQQQQHQQQQQWYEQQSHPQRQPVEPHTAGPPLTRAEKIQKLRADHQRRHRERQGHYPMEDKEEEYERQIQEDENKMFGQSAIQGDAPSGQRSRPQSRNQMERPNSRLGYQDRYHSTSNYQDYNEINNYSHGNRFHSDSNIRPQYLQRPASRGQTPTNEQWYYAEDPEMRRDNGRPPPGGGGGGYYGNAALAYRDPIYPTVAGKRPVKSIGQPNSAKV